MPIGFVAYSSDIQGLYSLMLKKHFLRLGWFALGAFIRKPKIFIKLLGSYKILKNARVTKKKETHIKEEINLNNDKKQVHIMSIAVTPNCKSHGVGTELINHLKANIDASEYSGIILSTEAENNEAANNFYIKNGFVVINQYVLQDGRTNNQYFWTIKSDE